jgi:transposase-like protein
MKTTKKNYFKNLVERLNNKDFGILKECIGERDQKKRVALLLQKDEKIICPYCNSDKSVKNGIRSDLQRYKCKSCKKNYNILTGTPLARLRKKGRWLDYSSCLNEGVTIRESAVLVGVHRNTTFRWRHRFLMNSINLKPDTLNGVVEATESYFRYSEKGKKFFEHPEKVGQKVYVVFNRDRGRNIYEQIVENFDLDKVSEKFNGVYSKDILFCSENSDLYKNFVLEKGLRHGTLNLKTGELIKKDVVHLFNVENYKEELYKWLKRFRGVATKYLNNYLSWYRELDEYNQNVPPEILLVRAKSLDRYKYQPLTVPKAKNDLPIPP